VSQLKRVLVANRGEIAIRIAKAARDLGMEAIGVYTKADEWSLHTRFMSSAHALQVQPNDTRGPVAAYLDAATIVAIAVETGCDSIHPGYGFLSESAELASLCEQSDLRFVGPVVQALEVFGDKSRALKLAQSLSIPTVPGSDGLVGNVEEALTVAGHSDIR
jgi:pyruvate carboxylase subunit A